MPSKVLTSAGGAQAYESLLAFLVAQFPHISQSAWISRMERGLVTLNNGLKVRPNTSFQAGLEIHYEREVANERTIPFSHTVIYEDERILVADKPHFLPTVPSGPYVKQTLIHRLQFEQNNAELAPAHRLDRDTAGLVLFTKRKTWRGAYQTLFRDNTVKKTYFAIAPRTSSSLQFPITRHSFLERSEHFMQARERFDKPANARTTIELVEVLGHRSLYKLTPSSGQRHQLRVHMLGLGLPIENDGIYPALEPEVQNTDAAWDARYQRPLKLLAQRLEFIDPISNELRAFESTQKLRL